MNRFRFIALALLGVLVLAPSASGQAQHPDITLFFQAASPDRETSEDALDAIAENWQDGYAALLMEWIRFLPSGRSDDNAPALGGGGGMIDGETFDPSRGDPLDGGSRFASRRNPRVQTRERIVGFLEKQTRQKFGDDVNAWREWVWNQPYNTHPQIGAFKANLYGQVDQRFKNFFQGNAAIRVDEVSWGGVGVSGIPALDHPQAIPASQASYLADSDIVFGFANGGEARAYPKRILAWHELAWDAVGGEEMTIVYCTLCGTVIPYKSTVGGRQVKFDTSGLLYRSNKLLFDDISFTLWSSLTGEPVLGRMVGAGVRLAAMPVVTTTWGEWKRTHPDTTVLSLDTGHQRDYGEGVAYADYFATDEIMFKVPSTDSRLPNKAEVLTLRFPKREGGDHALAISADFLASNRLYQTNFAGRDLLVVTSPAGANRVYAASGKQFVELVDDTHVRDSEGTVWEVTESGLSPAGNPDAAMPRLAAARAFWFGWFAQYPETELVTN